MINICKIKDIYSALYSFERSFTEKYNITINEAMVLCFLKDGQLKSAHDLTEHLGVSISRMSRVIKTMEEKELIQRKTEVTDKRVMLFTLAQNGRDKVASIQEEGFAAFDRFRDDLEELIKKPVAI